MSGNTSLESNGPSGEPEGPALKKLVFNLSSRHISIDPMARSFTSILRTIMCRSAFCCSGGDFSISQWNFVSTVLTTASRTCDTFCDPSFV